MRSTLIAMMLFLTAACVYGKTIECKDTDQFLKAIQSLSPGTIVIVHDGIYGFDDPITLTAAGTKADPILIRAKNRGKAQITGRTSMILKHCAFVTIEGLDFAAEASTAIRLEGCDNVRITRNHFRLHEKGRGSWVMITGDSKDTLALSHHNMIDRNFFEQKKELGNFITIEGTKKKSSAVSQYDVIERNHFRDIGPRQENVLEAIRAGSSEYTLSRGHALIQQNLFERCDGDPEYVSIKMSDCTVRGNTFVECLGSLSLRHGNHSTVEGNVIIGNHRTGTFKDSTGKMWTLGTGGVRFCADSMTISGNYFEGLTGTEWDATIAATNGDADYGEGKALTKHYRITNSTVEDNLLFDNASGIEIGFDGAGFQGNWWNLPPRAMTIRGNIVAGSKDTLIRFFTPPVNSTFGANIVHPAKTAAASSVALAGITVADPHLKRINGLMLPAGNMSRYSGLRRLAASDVGPNAR